MGSILFSVTDIPEANLIYDEDETRRILKFFWPSFSSEIDAMQIATNARVLA